MPRVITISGSRPFKKAKGRRIPMTRKVGRTTLHRSTIGWVDRERGVAYRKRGAVYGLSSRQWCVTGVRGQRVALQGRCYKTLKAAVRAVNR